MRTWVTYIPHVLTSLRFLSFIPIVALHLEGHGVAALLVVALAFLSDFEGALARRLNCCSQFGEWFDPLADKVLCGTLSAIMISEYDFAAIVMIPVATIVIYDCTTITCRLMNFTVKTSVIAKWKTAVLMASLGLMFIDISLVDSQYDFLGELGLRLLWVSMGLTVVSGIYYIQAIRWSMRRA